MMANGTLDFFRGQISLSSYAGWMFNQIIWALTTKMDYNLNKYKCSPFQPATFFCMYKLAVFGFEYHFSVEHIYNTLMHIDSYRNSSK